MAYHYDQQQVEEAVEAMLGRLRAREAKGPMDLACVRAMEALAPVLMRFQIAEINGGHQADHSIGAMIETFAWWVHHLARNATPDRGNAEAFILHMVQHLAQGAISRLDGESMTIVKGERGGRA